MRIGVDLDGTVVDLMPVWKRHYQMKFKKELIVDRWEFLDDLCANERKAMLAFLEHPGLFEHLPYLPGAEMGLYKLSREHELVFVTSHTGPNSAKGKVSWVLEHHPDIPCVLIQNKSMLNLDILIDDHPGHAQHFSLSFGLRTEYNKNYADRYLALCNTWSEIVEKVQFLAAISARTEPLDEPYSDQ